MGRIQTSIGLITGTDIQGTVDQLIALSSIPRDQLVSRNDTLAQQQDSLSQLTASVIGVQLSGDRLGAASLFTTRKDTSSNEEALSVSSEGGAALGNYTVTTQQLAATHSVSSRQQFASTEEALGFSGEFSIRNGGQLEQSIPLQQLNDGLGVQQGSIQITDRSGASATIDLTNVRSIEQVLEKINQNTTVSVRASADRDGITLTDLTGQTLSNLRVDEVGGGETAADLGLYGINVAANTAVGHDLTLGNTAAFNSSTLSDLGAQFNTGNDLQIGFADGSSLAFDLGQEAVPAVAPTGSTNSGNANASLDFTDLTEAHDFEGLTVTFNHDALLVSGNPSYQLSGSGSGQTLEITINDSLTTATQIADLINNDAALGSKLQVQVEGTGTGMPDRSETTVLEGAAAIAAVPHPETIGELVAQLNALDPSRLSAEIAEGTTEIVLTDLTSGGDPFTISDLGTSNLSSLLGFPTSSLTGTLKTPPKEESLFGVSLSELNGGQGVGALSSLDITLRDGSSANVDLSNAETVQQVIDSINNSGLQMVAKLDDSKTGIRLRDLSGGVSSNFTVSSSDATATALGIATDSEETIVDGSHLGRQYVNRDTLLSDLNQGLGVSAGSFKVTDSTGAASAINLTIDEIENVGQLIDKVNDLGLGITASLNAKGDGIQIVDTAGGSGALKIENSGNGLAATQLGIAGSATTQTINGESVEAIVGGDSLSIQIEATDSLDTIVEKINASEQYVKASVVREEEGGFSLRLTSRKGGELGQFSIDSIGFTLPTETTSRGQDAQILLADDTGGSRLLSSVDGVFEDESTGLNLTLKALSDDPISVSVAENPEAVVSAVKTLVTQYNLLRDKLDGLTFYDAESSGSGLLFGSTEALRVEMGYSRLMSGIMRGNGEISSLAEVGIRLNDTGRLELDETKLKERLSTDSEAVEKFFTNEDTGVAARLNSLADRLAGVDNGMLLTRGNALTTRVERNNERIDAMNVRLENERERLLTQFYTMESAIAKIQSNSQYVSGIQPLSFAS